MARLTVANKIVDSDSDSDLPEMSTIFSAKSIATPRKNLVPRASSVARDQEPSILSGKKPRRRVLGKATDNVLLRPLGRDIPVPDFEGRREKVVRGGKTLFDEEDVQPRARRGGSRPAIALRRKIIDIAKEEKDKDIDGAEAKSSYVRPKVVTRAPALRTVQATASEQAAKVKPKAARDVMEDLDFGNLTIAQLEPEDEFIYQPKPTSKARATRKPAAPNYGEPESSEPEHIEEPKEEELEKHAESEFENEAPPSPTPEKKTRSIPIVINDPSPSEKEDSEEEEVDILEASCLEDDVAPECELEPSPVPARAAAPEGVPRAVPQSRLPSNIFAALQNLPPPKAPSPATSTAVEDDVEKDDDHIDTLEASCLEDDDEGEVEEGTAEVPQVYEHQESDEEEEENEDASDDMSDFIVSDDEEDSSASVSDAISSEEDSPLKTAPKSTRRLDQGRKKASPPPAARDLVVDFQWSDDDNEDEERAFAVDRKLFKRKNRDLPTLIDSEVEDVNLILGPHTPSESEAEPERERTPRSNKKQAEPSKRLKSPTKTKISRLVASPPRRQSTDAFWEPEVINNWNDEYSPQKKLFQSPTKSAKPVSRLKLGGKEVPDIDLLQSPTKAQVAKAKKAEKDAIKEWEASKNTIALAFLSELDQKVTNSEVSRMSESTGGVKIIWSTKLNTTAGRAHWKREGLCRKPTPHNPNPVPIYNHHCSIELATKVIKDTHQLINVLAHEFCHLTTFMISKELKNPHGAEFKSWGRKVERAMVGRDIVVTTKHSYEIQWKYVWQCQGCRRDVGRHSKSIDTKRMRCGNCKGELVQIKPVPRGGVKLRPSTLFPDAVPRDGDSAFFDGVMRESSGNASKKEPTKPKQITEYQLFVKENMARIKADNPGSPMKEVMGLVGAKYREHKASRKLFGDGGRLKEIKLKSAETGVERLANGMEILDLTND